MGGNPASKSPCVRLGAFKRHEVVCSVLFLRSKCKRLQVEVDRVYKT